MFRPILILLFVFFSGKYSSGNNLQISTVTLSTAGGSQYLNFTLSWDNSWRMSSNPGNWDAVWVFVKRRDCAAPDWHHVNLSPDDAAHTISTPLFVDAYPDKKGVMIYRNTDGAGNISNSTVQLKLDNPPSGNFDYQVFGVEMVYIPQGAFYLGDGFANATFRIGNTVTPFFVRSEGSIYFSPTANDLWSAVGGFNYDSIRAPFPKGYNAFYCMKYEISQGQYADFLNNIPQDAALNRFSATNSGTYRYTISGIWPAIAATVPDRACNWLGFKDVAAYLDWAALSPMTELEYEKACRGDSSNYPLSGEFAWGGITVTDADLITAGTDGQPAESSSSIIITGSGLANLGNDGVLGPLRCGFAAKTATNRFEAGASYYGVMELSGNVFEKCYNVFFGTFGRSGTFNGSHGDGELSLTPEPGFANQGWPVESGPTDAAELSSVTIKGGAWISENQSELMISDRSHFTSSPPTIDIVGRSNALGGRGVSRR